MSRISIKEATRRAFKFIKNHEEIRHVLELGGTQLMIGNDGKLISYRTKKGRRKAGRRI